MRGTDIANLLVRFVFGSKARDDSGAGMYVDIVSVFVIALTGSTWYLALPVMRLLRTSS